MLLKRKYLGERRGGKRNISEANHETRVVWGIPV